MSLAVKALWNTTDAKKEAVPSTIIVAPIEASAQVVIPLENVEVVTPGGEPLIVDSSMSRALTALPKVTEARNEAVPSIMVVPAREVNPDTAKVQGTKTEFNVAVPPTEAAPETVRPQAIRAETSVAVPLMLTPEVRIAEPPSEATAETVRVEVFTSSKDAVTKFARAQRVMPQATNRDASLVLPDAVMPDTASAETCKKDTCIWGVVIVVQVFSPEENITQAPKEAMPETLRPDWMLTEPPMLSSPDMVPPEAKSAEFVNTGTPFIVDASTSPIDATAETVSVEVVAF